jgi:hypothetical protein
LINELCGAAFGGVIHGKQLDPGRWEMSKSIMVTVLAIFAFLLPNCSGDGDPMGRAR